MRTTSITSLFVSIYFLTTLVLAEDIKLDLTNHTGVLYPSEVKIDKGFNFTVIIKANPSTGFAWMINPQDL